MQQSSRPNNNNHCFKCGSPSHFANACPQAGQSQGQGFRKNDQNKGKKQTVQVRQGRINFTTLADLPEGAPVMSGTFSINHHPAVILFDSGASHSFISTKFGARAGLDFCDTKGSYMISTLGGKIASNQIIRGVPLKLGSKIIPTDLILLALEGMDVILGMEWMNRHGVILDFSSRAIELNSPTFGNSTTSSRIHQLLCIEDIPVVCEYAMFFRMTCLECH